MAFIITLSALSAGMEDAVIARFLKRPGEHVEKGEILAEVETDKATMEIEAEASGTLADLPVKEGERVKVGDPVAILLGEGEEAPVPAAPPASSLPGIRQDGIPSADRPPEAASVSTGASPRHRASPLARRLAEGRGIEIASIAGSGPRGRVVRIDVEKAVAAAPATHGVSAETPLASVRAEEVNEKPHSDAAAIPAGIGAYESVPHSAMRRTIARRLVEAKSTIPHFYLEASCEIDALLELRTRINAERSAEKKISVNDFVIKAVAGALQSVPEANVIYTEEAMLKLAAIDIAVAVATPGGLITPIVRNANLKSIGTISAEVKALAARARENALKPDEYKGGGFTISNLGMYGVSAFSAIINPPHSAILAVGAAERKPVLKGDDIVPATVMQCTLSVDHRVIDGAMGATFLKEFRAILENPLRILA